MENCNNCNKIGFQVSGFRFQVMRFQDSSDKVGIKGKNCEH